MKQVFEIKDKNTINSVLDHAQFGTLALSVEDNPYAVPVNFVRIEENIYFHGALSNKKMKLLKANPKVSFSVVEDYALIPSYFSSSEGLACPATQFFKSVSVQGEAMEVESIEVKREVFEVLMKKHQPEGKYLPFSNEAYNKALNATAVVQITPNEVRAKFKFGQHLNDERFEMILTHLQERNNPLDKETIALMKQLKKS